MRCRSQAAASEAGAEHAETTLWCHVLLLHALLPPPPAAPDDIAVHQTLVQGPPPRGENTMSVRGVAQYLLQMQPLLLRDLPAICWFYRSSCVKL